MANKLMMRRKMKSKATTITHNSRLKNREIAKMPEGPTDKQMMR
jgi:hypothetical protein